MLFTAAAAVQTESALNPQTCLAFFLTRNNKFRGVGSAVNFLQPVWKQRPPEPGHEHLTKWNLWDHTWPNRSRSPDRYMCHVCVCVLYLVPQMSKALCGKTLGNKVSSSSKERRFVGDNRLFTSFLKMISRSKPWRKTLSNDRFDTGHCSDWFMIFCVMSVCVCCWSTPQWAPPPDQASLWRLPGSPLVPRGPGWRPRPDRSLSQSGGAPMTHRPCVRPTTLHSEIRFSVLAIYAPESCSRVYLSLVDAIEAVSWRGCGAENMSGPCLYECNSSYPSLNMCKLKNTSSFWAFVDKRLHQNFQSIQFFYLNENRSLSTSHSQSKKLQLGESLLVELVRGTPLLSSWTQRDRILLSNKPNVEKWTGSGFKERYSKRENADRLGPFFNSSVADGDNQDNEAAVSLNGLHWISSPSCLIGLLWVYMSTIIFSIVVTEDLTQPGFGSLYLTWLCRWLPHFKGCHDAANTATVILPF